MQGIFVCANQPLFWSQQANEAVYTAHGCLIIGKVCAIFFSHIFEVPQTKSVPEFRFSLTLSLSLHCIVSNIAAPRQCVFQMEYAARCIYPQSTIWSQ